MVQNAREFLLAIKESTHTVFDDEAVEFLDNLRKYMSAAMDTQKIKGEQRDSIVFFEGMLRGVQLQLKRKEQESRGRLNAMGLLAPDGNPKLPNM